MAFHDDVVDDITAQFTTIGLSTTADASGEIVGGGYAALAPTYDPAAAGAADLTAPLAFDGPANAGPVTHVIFRRVAGVWVVRPADAPLSFNSDGRLDVVTAPVTSAFPA